MINRGIHVIYCDDIREEFDGKRTFVGVYNAELIVNKTPSFIPKLVIHVETITPKDNPFQRLVFRIKRNNEIIVESDLTAQDLQRSVPVSPRRNTESIAISGKMFFIFSPFEIDGPCTLSVEIETESEILNGARLHILDASSDREAKGA